MTKNHTKKRKNPNKSKPAPASPAKMLSPNVTPSAETTEQETTPNVETQTSTATPPSDNMSMVVQGSDNTASEGNDIVDSSTERMEVESAPGAVPFEAFNSKNDGFAKGFDELSDHSDDVHGEVGEEAIGKIYVVVQQMVENQITASPVGEPGDWPYFVSISDALIKGDRKLRLGDLIEVISFEWREEYRHLSGREGGHGRFWIHKGVINAQATVTVCAPLPQKQVLQQPGIIIEVRVDNKKRRLQSIVVASPGLHPSQRMFRRQFGTDFEVDIQPGTVVMVGTVQVTRPSNFKTSQHYILPEKTPFFFGSERMTYNPTVAVELNKTPLKYEFPFPPSLPNISFSEGVVAAAISACSDRLENDLAQFTITSVPEIVSSTTTSFNAWIYQWMETKKELVEYAKRWEEDQPLQMKISHRDCAKPSGHGFIVEAHREKLETGFFLKIRIQMAWQPAKKYDSYEDFIRIRDGGAEGEFRPMQSLDALNKREMRFLGHMFSDWATGNADDNRIGQALLGLGEKMPIRGLTWQQLTERHPALSTLCAGQQTTALLMMDEERRIVYAQAPPGTGKTHCAASIAAAILAEDERAVVLCVAPLNIATARLCEEMQNALEKEGLKIPLLALFSGNGKHRYAQQLQQISQHLLATAVSAPELQDVLKAREGSDKKKVDRYLEQCERNPRQTDEGTVAQILLALSKRRVIFCTLSLGEQIGTIFEKVSHVIVDESGQAPYAQLLSFLTNFSSIKKVLITGDKFQLHVNMMDLPPAVHTGFGLDTAIINFDHSVPVDSTTFTISFRSHPIITLCIEAGTYADKGQQIISGRTAAEMQLFTGNDNFRLPVKDSPLLFMHITDQMEQEETSFSSSNPRQTDATITLLKTFTSIFKGTIRVVCLYSGQTADIQRRCAEEGIRGAIINTSDSTQGYEADLTLVVTTLSGFAQQEGFWSDEARVNVALSRSRHGLVVTPEYLDFYTDPDAHFVDGVLTGPAGQQLTAHGFYMGNKLPYFRPKLPQLSNQPSSSHPQSSDARPEHSYAAVAQSDAPSGRTFYGRQQNATPRQFGVCFRCNKKGHSVRNCPHRFVGER